MSNLEFDILDELYFVASFREICEAVSLPEKEMTNALIGLTQRGFVKCFYPDPDTEIQAEKAVSESRFSDCYFLATKAGLLAHNSK